MTTHGTKSAYNRGCRCEACREASRLARSRQRQTARERAKADEPKSVTAEPMPAEPTPAGPKLEEPLPAPTAQPSPLETSAERSTPSTTPATSDSTPATSEEPGSGQQPHEVPDAPRPVRLGLFDSAVSSSAEVWQEISERLLGAEMHRTKLTPVSSDVRTTVVEALGEAETAFFSSGGRNPSSTSVGEASAASPPEASRLEWEMNPLAPVADQSRAADPLGAPGSESPASSSWYLGAPRQMAERFESSTGTQRANTNGPEAAARSPRPKNPRSLFAGLFRRVGVVRSRSDPDQPQYSSHAFTPPARLPLPPPPVQPLPTPPPSTFPPPPGSRPPPPRPVLEESENEPEE